MLDIFTTMNAAEAVPLNLVSDTRVMDTTLVPHLITLARQHEITQIVIGSNHRGWWHNADGGPIVRQ